MLICWFLNTSFKPQNFSWLELLYSISLSYDTAVLVTETTSGLLKKPLPLLSTYTEDKTWAVTAL